MTNENGKALLRGMMALRLEVYPMIVESLMVLARKAIDEAHAAGFREGALSKGSIHPRCGKPCRATDSGRPSDCTCGCNAQPAATGEGAT